MSWSVNIAYIAWWQHMTLRIWVHTGSGKGLMPDGTNPDSKVHGANMGPIWGREDHELCYLGSYQCWLAISEILGILSDESSLFHVSCFLLIRHILFNTLEAWTKWRLFCKITFSVCFVKWILAIESKSSLVQVKASGWTDNKPLHGCRPKCRKPWLNWGSVT